MLQSNILSDFFTDYIPRREPMLAAGDFFAYSSPISGF